MKKIILSIVVLFLLFNLSACVGKNPEGQVEENKKITVIVTLFPQYDFARHIAGDKADIILLLPPGVEPHSYEPTPKDIVEIMNADIFIYTGKHMEPWVEKLAGELREKGITVTDISKGINPLNALEQNYEHEQDDTGKDPHFWLDPVIAQKIVSTIAEVLSEKDYENREYYSVNAEAYIDELEKLNEEFKDSLKKARSRKIFYSGHSAFAYFAKRYSLEFINPYHSISPDSEPTPKDVAVLIDELNKSERKYIYYEELVQPRVAQIIAGETGSKMLKLNGLHNVSAEELKNGITYLEVMKENIENIKEGLGCGE